MSHIRINQQYVIAVFSAVGICCCLFGGPKCSAAEVEPDTPLLTQWRQAVVERVQGYGEREKLTDFSWPEDQVWPGLCIAGSVPNNPLLLQCLEEKGKQSPLWTHLKAWARQPRPRIICQWNDGYWLQFFEVSRRQRRPLGAFRTSDVFREEGDLRRYCVVAGGDSLYALFLDWHRPIIKHAYRLVPGQAPEEVPVQTIPNRESILLVDSGQCYGCPSEYRYYEGPLSLVDANGYVHARAVLPADWGLYGNPLRTIEDTGEQFLIALKGAQRSDWPSHEAYLERMLLMEVERGVKGHEPAASTLFVSAKEPILQLLPALEPERAQIVDVAFLGDSIHGRIAVKKVTEYRFAKEQLYCIELWAYRDGRAAVLIDLIAWYNARKQSFHYWTGNYGEIHEAPMAYKTSFNFNWQLVPVASGPDKLVYAREDGIWQVKLP